MSKFNIRALGRTEIKENRKSFEPSILSDLTAQKSRVRVVARFRPLNEIEMLIEQQQQTQDSTECVQIDDNLVTLKDNFYISSNS